MAFADTSTYTLAYAIESTFDTPLTAQTGVYTLLRNTGESLNTTLESARSDEIDSSRQYTGSVHVSGNSAGSVNYQLSYGEYDEFLQAVLQSPDWTIAYTDSGTSITVGGLIAGVTSTAGVVIGMAVKISGLTASAENGVYFVESFVANTSITVIGAFTAETVAVGVDTDGYIVNGSTERSYTFEKNFQVDGTNNYFSMSGMRAGTLSMALSTGSILSGEIGFQGATGVATGATPNDSAYIAAGTNELMNSVSNVQGLVLDALAVNGALTNIPTTFQELSVSLNNNLRDQTAVGNLFPAGIGSGRIDVEATATLYFSDQNFFDQFIVNGSVQLRFIMQDGTGNSYGVILPELKIASHEVTASGADSDVMAAVTFAGIKDSRFGTSSSIIITRMVA